MIRLDHVGSFLRPKELKDARQNYKDSKITKEELRLVENKCIEDLLKTCNENHLYYLTDGEFKRSWWHLDFYWGFSGINKLVLNDGFAFGNTTTRAESLEVIGKITCENHPFLDNFQDLVNIAKKLNIDISRLKITIPSPSMFLYTLYINPNNSAKDYFYKDKNKAKDDILLAYEIFYKKIYNLGCRYIHFDDVSFALFCDENIRKRINDFGLDVKDCMNYQIDLFNESLKSMPKDMMSAMHACRGNFKSQHYASGAYDFVAEALFKKLNVNKFFLEFDDERSGDFNPLKHINNQTVVLGILSTKTDQNPSLEYLVSRIYEASKYLSVNQIEFSTQCGFSSTEEGNLINYDSQWKKINLLHKLNETLQDQGFYKGE